MIQVFKKFGVTKEHIEKRLAHNMDATQPAELKQLGQIYNSLRDGMSKPSAWFDIEETAVQEDAALTEKIKNNNKPLDIGEFLLDLEKTDPDGLMDALQACNMSNIPVTKTGRQKVYDKYMEAKTDDGEN